VSPDAASCSWGPCEGGKGITPERRGSTWILPSFFDERPDDADHSRVTCDLRHMVDAGKCEIISAFQGLVRFTGVPPLSRASGPGPRPPTPQPGPHPGTTAAIKSGAQPYIRTHAPLPATPPTASYCVRSLKAGLRPSDAKKKPGGRDAGRAKNRSPKDLGATR
jgi:hypothetical protein